MSRLHADGHLENNQREIIHYLCCQHMEVTPPPPSPESSKKYVQNLYF